MNPDLTSAEVDDLADPSHAAKLRTIARQLRAIKKYGPLCLSSGICWNVVKGAKALGVVGREGDLSIAIGDLLVSMGLDRHYPVVVDGEVYAGWDQDRHESYGEFLYEELPGREFWDRGTPYGAARWALLDEMIDFLAVKGY